MRRNSKSFTLLSWVCSHKSKPSYFQAIIIFQKGKWYFVLDSEIGILRLFKSPEETESEKTLYLQGGFIQKTETIVWDQKRPLACFEYKLHNDVLLIIPEIGTSIEEIRGAFEQCSKLPAPTEETIGDKFKDSVFSVLKVPWEATSLVIGTLEEISEGAKIAPAKIFDDQTEKLEESKHPTNIATGLLRGTGAILQSVLSALAGIFVEPVKGAQKSGFKGAMAGLGKGMIELVLKPVAGTLDLVTLTARGIANTPTTIYLSINGMIKKKNNIKKMDSACVKSPSKLGKRPSHSSLQSHRGDIEDDLDFDIDRAELRRQVVEALEKIKKSHCISATEQVSGDLLNEIIKIQKLQQEELEKRKSIASPSETIKIASEKLAIIDQNKIEEEHMKFANHVDYADIPENNVIHDFPGLNTAIGEECESPDENLIGFDEIEEFAENDPNRSVLSATNENIEDFVTVKSDDPEDNLPNNSGFITPKAEDTKGSTFGGRHIPSIFYIS